MGLGVSGPIREMAVYGLARTFRIVSTKRNHAAATCKGCGTDVEGGRAHEVLVEGQRMGQGSFCYLCHSCFGPVKAANERFPNDEPLPDWWPLLDREDGLDARPAPLSEEELEATIRDRERQTGTRREQWTGE